MADLLNVDWMLTLNHLLLMASAYLLAFPIGFDREEQGPRIGLRTFPLVAVVSCGFMLVGRAVIDSPGEQGRVLQGIVTGIGFIGGGAILKDDSRVIGTATAASIWNCGAIGVAVAYHHLEIAIALSALNFFTLRYMGRLVRSVTGEPVVEDGQTTKPVEVRESDNEKSP